MVLNYYDDTMFTNKLKNINIGEMCLIENKINLLRIELMNRTRPIA